MNTKYKNILFSGLIASVILVTTSCNLSEQEPYSGAATISASSAAVTISADDFQKIPGVEKDETYTYTVSLSEPQISDVKIQVWQSGGTATEGEDFDLGEHTLTIPAYETSTTGTITTYADDEVEDAETLQITIGDETTANVIFTPQVYDFVLDNYVSDALDISLMWETDLEWGGTYSSCDYIDWDFYVADAAGFDINDPWVNTYAFWEAESSDCPETMSLVLGDWEVGEYVVWGALWSNQYYYGWDEKPVPITSTFTRAGAFKQTLAQDNADAMLSTQPGAAEDTDFNVMIATVTITDLGFVVKSPDGDEIVSGKIVNGKMRTARPAGSGLNKTEGPVINR